jgi:hypothetical protein
MRINQSRQQRFAATIDGFRVSGNGWDGSNESDCAVVNDDGCVRNRFRPVKNTGTDNRRGFGVAGHAPRKQRDKHASDKVEPIHRLSS